MAGLGGQPSTPTATALDGAEVARRTMMATEAASMAAQAAAAALERKTGGGDDRSWFKVLPKPAGFDPKSREDELAQWRDFSWGLEQYLASLDSEFPNDFQELRDHPMREVDQSIQTDEVKQRGMFLFSLLASLVRQRPLAVIKQVKNANGFEAYRQLIQSLEPASKNRSLGLLTMLLEWSPFDMKKGGLLNQLLKLEEGFTEYERTGSRLEDNIKFAILMKCVSGQLKTWLQLNVAESQSYSKLREAVIQYDGATLRWSSAMMLGQESKDGAVPMEIDRLQMKGKGPKGKGKGKEQSNKGKGKGDAKEAKSKGKGQKGQESTHKGGSKSSGKGEQQKGKGKTQPVRECYVCGKPGHLARDCWRVRQVAESPGGGDRAESATVLSSTSSGQATTTRPAIKRIEEVSQEFNTPIVFDLRGLGGDAGMEDSIKMIAFYNMAEEDVADEEEELLMEVRMVREGGDEWFSGPEDSCDIVIDSGADATVLPASYIDVGTSLGREAPKLQDAQGEAIKIKGYKSVNFCFETEDGRKVEIKEKAHFAEGIGQPILSFGKMMSSGWGIDGTQPALTFGPPGDGQVRIPLKMQNKSLIAEGSVRAIQVEPRGAEGLKAKLSEELEKKVRFQGGWKRDQDTWVGVHLAQKYQTPQYVPEITAKVDWKRTTSVKKEGKWLLMEMCEALHGMADQEEAIEGATEKQLVLTILTKEGMSTEEMGFEVEEALPPAQLEVKEHELPFDEPNAQQNQADGHVPQPADVEQEGRLVVGKVLPEKIVVNEVELCATSPLRQLRAACNFFGVSQSGSRSKCFERLVSHMRERELKAAAEAVAAAQMEESRQPRAPPLIEVPSQEEQDKRNLTHTPYAPWCECCLMHRGRPDRHLRSGASRLTGLPIISLDFCYTKAGSMDRNPRPPGRPPDDEAVDVYGEEEPAGGGEVPLREVKQACWLMMVDSHTGYLGAVPLKSKGQLNIMAREVMTFIQNLGHTEVGLYGDNEPTIRSLLRIVLNSRHAMGLRTRLYTTRVRDSAGNSLAENAIQRVRELAATVMEYLMKNTGLKLNTNHGLWSWAARHACWMLNRYQASKGITSYELVHGKTYDGLVVPFGNPVYAYTKPQTGKGNPKWRLALFLGKTEGQDAWLVGDGSQVMLTRSVRRVDRPWSKFLAYYQDFQTYTWEYQVSFGGRVVPTKRALGPVALKSGNFPPMEMILFRHRDEDAEAVQAYAESKEGQEEAQRELEEARALEQLAQEREEGEPAPRAPQVEEEPRRGMPTTPAPEDQSGERSSVPTMVVLPMPWEEQGSLSAGRVLKKSAPPLSAVKAEPEFKKQRLEEESAKRPRREGPGTSSSSTPGAASHEQMVERRVQKVCVGDEEMYQFSVASSSPLPPGPCPQFPARQFPVPVPCPQFPVPTSLSQVPCPQFAGPSSLPPSSLPQFPAPSSLSPVPCPKFPVPSLLPPVPCPQFPAPVPPQFPSPSSLSPVCCPSSLPPSSLPQFPAPSSLSPVPCSKFPVSSLLPPVPCPSSLSQFPAPSSLSQFAAPSSLSQVPCLQFAASSSLPPTSLSQFPAPTSLSPVPCPKFPVPILLPPRFETLHSS